MRSVDNIHPEVKELLSFFEYKHLPPFLQEVSKPFHELAWAIALNDNVGGAQVRDGLFDLLRAKDCIVRAAVFNPLERSGT
jgi:hypothetical protein